MDPQEKQDKVREERHLSGLQTYLRTNKYLQTRLYSRSQSCFYGTETDFYERRPLKNTSVGLIGLECDMCLIREPNRKICLPTAYQLFKSLII